MIYSSGNAVSLGVAPSESAAKLRCGKHALHAIGRPAGILKPLVWTTEEVDSWFAESGSNTYRVAKK